MIDLTQKYEHYRNRFREAMNARQLTNEEVAARIEAHPVTISKLRTGKTMLDDEWRAKVAEALRIHEDTLFGDGPLPLPDRRDVFKPLKKRGRKPANDNRDLPVYGLAAGSLKGSLIMSTEVIETVPCPPGLRNVPGAYALRTHGDSMQPRYFPKDILYINPNQQIKMGDHVIVQLRYYEDSATETWVKRYDTQDDNEIYVSQYNPVARMSFRREYVLNIHRVLPINELYPSQD